MGFSKRGGQSQEVPMITFLGEEDNSRKGSESTIVSFRRDHLTWDSRTSARWDLLTKKHMPRKVNGWEERCLIVASRTLLR